MAYTAMPDPDMYRTAIRGPGARWYTVDATYAGALVASGLRPLGGQITDTTKPGVRRVLSLDLAPEPGLFDTLAPIGTTLTVTAQVRLTGRGVISIPMGVFDVDAQSSDNGQRITITAPDRWVKITRARFVLPETSTRNSLVVDQIAALIRGALGASEPVNITATSTARVPALTWEKDRDAAIIDLAKSIGAWVYFDRDGIATVADVPTAGPTADWLVDASAAGVATSIDRERSRSVARNVVVVESSATEGAKFATQYVWDDDPSSPTYAGTNPVSAPGSAGPFGIVTAYYDTPVLASAASARTAGKTILARSMGLASQVSLGQVPNPAVDAFDVLDVLPPRERYDLARPYERHIADTVTHPFAPGGVQQIDGRSTRTDEIDGGS